jgi:ubiquinone/menaquinone biosynthesis C-methylase UbiE
MGFYTDHVVPRLVHWALQGGEIEDLRARAVSGLAGTVLEVGFGSGLNLLHYPASVERLWAVEPSDVAWRMARQAIARVPFPVERTGSTAEAIPLPDDAADAAVSTFTLCTVPDVERALAEIRRVLRPGGAFRFVEHGRTAEPRIARWQDRLTPIQKRLAGGCHLNREIDRLVWEAGFRLERLACFYIRGPKVGTHIFQGTAVPL